MVIVEDFRCQEVDGRAQLSANVVDCGRAEFRIWFRYPIEYREYLADTANPFVPSLLLYSMRERH